MVPRETILDRAAAWGADIIGVSGLITPSLFQMEELCREMSARGLSTPLLVGGATTSALHTAVKLAPLYGHVFYAPDASASAVLAGRLMSDRTATETEEHRKQEEMRELRNRSSAAKKTGEESPETPSVAFGSEPSRTAFLAKSYLHGAFFESIPARELSIAEVLPYFDWPLFYAIWRPQPEQGRRAGRSTQRRRHRAAGSAEARRRLPHPHRRPFRRLPRGERRHRRTGVAAADVASGRRRRPFARGLRSAGRVWFRQPRRHVCRLGCRDGKQSLRYDGGRFPRHPLGRLRLRSSPSVRM